MHCYRVVNIKKKLMSALLAEKQEYHASEQKAKKELFGTCFSLQLSLLVDIY